MSDRPGSDEGSFRGRRRCGLRRHDLLAVAEPIRAGGVLAFRADGAERRKLAAARGALSQIDLGLGRRGLLLLLHDVTSREDPSVDEGLNLSSASRLHRLMNRAIWPVSCRSCP